MTNNKLIVSVVSAIIMLALLSGLFISNVYAEAEPVGDQTTAEIADPGEDPETTEEPGETTEEPGETTEEPGETTEEPGETTEEPGETTEEPGETTEDPYAITHIAFETDIYRIAPGEELTLSVIYEPEDAEVPVLIFTSSDETIATVDEAGKVSAITNGKVTVTAKTEDGNIEFSCTVIVSTSSVKFSVLTGTGEKIATGFKLGATVGEIITDICTAEDISRESVIMYNSDKTESAQNTSVATGMIISVDGIEYTVIIFGDVTGDGLINSEDTRKVAEFVTGSAALDRAFYIAADLLGTGDITIECALRIQRHVYGLTSIEQ